MDNNNQIKFSLYLDGWNYEVGDKKKLRKNSQEVITTDYTSEMKGNIFCPECCVELFRSPEDKDFDARGRKAFFAHTRKHYPDCGLRVKKAEGKRFENEELAKKAIEDEELVIVNGFMKDKPILPKNKDSQEYQGNPIEDQNGNITKVPIGRHNGESFNLPSKITTIRGLCRNFNKNVHKYFHFPNSRNAVLLQELLIDIKMVKKVDNVPKLYFGKIKQSWNCGRTSQNIRQTMIEYSRNNEYVDFCLKATDSSSQEHGIDDDSEGKVIIIYGVVSISGIGLCIENVGWGEFAVLPEKYESLL
jgi:hypothetical protein